MAEPQSDLLEIVLRDCASAQTTPWYPADFAQRTGLVREKLEDALDQLRMNGLVELTPWAQGHGQGYKATARGVEVLASPRLIGQLRQGSMPETPRERYVPTLEQHALEDMRGERVRGALLDEAKPIVTKLLVAANVVWFLFGLFIYTSRFNGHAGEFLAAGPMGGGNNDLSLTYIEMGSLLAPFVIELGQWWRLLSCGFVHYGVLHLGMNMYMLLMLGSLLERMWGRSIFLATYLLSLLGSSCLALLFSPPNANTMGASGAICGLLGSMATWVYLNRQHLPPAVANSWSRNIISNIILIGIISLLPGVSWQGHAGGGITGAIVAAPLNFARFGHGSRRILGWAGALAIAVVGLTLTYAQAVKNVTTHNDPAGKMEVLAANKKDMPLLHQADERAREAWSLESSVLNAPRKGLGDEKTAEIRGKLLKLHEKLNGDLAELQRLGPYRQSNLAATMKAGIAFIQASADLSNKFAKALDPEQLQPPPELDQLRAEHTRVERLFKAFGDAWKELNTFMDSQ